MKVARIYEREIDKSMEITNDESIENIYDAFMESIIESKELAIENYIKDETVK